MKRYSSKILLTLFSILLTLVLSEVWFRFHDLRGYHEPRTRQWDHALMSDENRLPGVQLQFRPNTSFELSYDSNPNGYFDENNSISYDINQYGFRGPGFDIRKCAGTTRIMVLGDSFTFGEGVRFEDTFCSRMNQILNQNSNQTVEVLNFGTSTWGTNDEFNYFEQAGIEFDPDVVILVYVLNDADYAGGLDLWENYRREYQNRYLKGSYLASYVYATVKRRIVGAKYIKELVENSKLENEKWEESLNYLLECKRLAELHDMRFMVAIFPFMYELNDDYPFLQLHEMVSGFCDLNDIAVLDLLPAFHGETYSALWVHPSDQHPNERGHEIAAEAISEYVIETGLLSGSPAATKQ